MQNSTTQHTASTSTDYQPPFIDEPELSDDEWFEFESLISRDHDDRAYWTGGMSHV